MKSNKKEDIENTAVSYSISELLIYFFLFVIGSNVESDIKKIRRRKFRQIVCVCEGGMSSRIAERNTKFANCFQKNTAILFYKGSQLEFQQKDGKKTQFSSKDCGKNANFVNRSQKTQFSSKDRGKNTNFVNRSQVKMQISSELEKKTKFKNSLKIESFVKK